jgi:hypothetical protein
VTFNLNPHFVLQNKYLQVLKVNLKSGISRLGSGIFGLGI